jgi:hypothetical protein
VRGYEVRPREDHRGVDLISDALPFGAALSLRYGVQLQPAFDNSVIDCRAATWIALNSSGARQLFVVFM